jgi:hypothetical protein
MFVSSCEFSGLLRTGMTLATAPFGGAAVVTALSVELVLTAPLLLGVDGHTTLR